MSQAEQIKCLRRVSETRVKEKDDGSTFNAKPSVEGVPTDPAQSASRLLGYVLVMTTVSVSAQPPEPYSIPRTVDGHPDFQGVWGIATLTMLERPPGLDGLIASPEAAAELVETIRARMPAVVDPDVQS